jgi:preprotein translocase subunit SecE
MAQGVTTPPAEKRKRTTPVQFVQQTRAEIAKVVWPSRREVLVTTGMVLLMTTILALFFSLIDLVIRQGLQGVLSFFGS